MSILVDTHPGYRQITLNRPDRLNALLPEMADAIIAALDDAQADGACRAVLLTGAGRGFCAGQDLTAIAGADPDDIDDLLDSLSSGHREDPRVAAAGGRRCQRRRGGRRVQSGARLRHRHRGALGEFRTRPLPASGWCRIAAAPGSCRASSGRRAPAR